MVTQPHKKRPSLPRNIIGYGNRTRIAIILIKQVEHRSLYFHGFEKFFSNKGKIEQGISRQIIPVVTFFTGTRSTDKGAQVGIDILPGVDIYTEVPVVLGNERKIVAAIIFWVLEGIIHKDIIVFDDIHPGLHLDALDMGIAKVFIT